MTLTLTDLLTGVDELRSRRRHGGLRSFQPQEQQLPVLASRQKGRLVLGGNRAGKTVLGAVDTVGVLLGEHRWRPVRPAPAYVWCASQDLPGTEGHRRSGSGERIETHKQLDELKRWIPRDALIEGSWARSYSPSEHTLRLANGSVAVFKSYEQPGTAFESDALDHVWFDEEPPRRTIFTSCLARLVDRDGTWILTATPLLSLQGACWIEDDLYEAHSPDSDWHVFRLSTLLNPHLQERAVRSLSQALGDEEREVRIEGAFARVGGRVYNEFRRSAHVVPAFRPHPDYRQYVAIDPGYTNPTAVLFAEVDPDGTFAVWEELYERERPPQFFLALIKAILTAHGVDPEQVTFLMDPSAWNRDPAGRFPVAYEWMHEAEALGRGWFIPTRANNDELAGVWRVKRYLRGEPREGVQRPRVYFSESAVNTIWEIERLTWKRAARGPSADQQHRPERPRDQDNHALDCLRYLINDQPDSLRTLPEPPKSRVELFWEHRNALLRESQHEARCESGYGDAW